MKNINIHLKVVCFILLGLIACPVVYAQQNNGRKDKKPKISTMEIKAVVVDDEEKPIANASVITGENGITIFTDKNGNFTIKVAANSTIIVEAFGYEDKVFSLADSIFPGRISLKREDLFATKESLVSRADGSQVYQRDLVGAVSSIDGKNLISYPDLIISNALQGKVAGLVVESSTSGLGNNVPKFYLRGLHTNGDNQAVVVIDGIERPLADVMAEEIEKIEFLKDPTSKILYGPRAANGVLWVTTRRGEKNRRTIKATVEMGTSVATRTPNYLNSYDYARLYNEARANDRKNPFYTQTQLEGYKNSAGSNDLLYPDVDYYDEFLNKGALYTKASTEFNGGSNKVRYAIVAGYTGGKGFEDVSSTPELNRFNLRGNLDIDFNKYISVVLGVAGRLEDRSWGEKDCAQIFSALSTHRPNEYPFTIDPAVIGIQGDPGEIPYFGASLRQPDNLYAATMYGGTNSERYTNSQLNLGLNLDLDFALKGLKAGAFITYDNYDYYSQGQSKVYPTYAVNSYINGGGDHDILFTQMREQNLETEQGRRNAETSRSSGWRANVSYQNAFGLHAIRTQISHNYAKYEKKGVAQDVINSNTTLHANYIFNNKYSIEADGALMGSNKFDDGNKFFFSPAVGASWIITNEDFLKGNEIVNFLKLKASYGILGFDANTDYLIHKTAWQHDGNQFAFGETNSGEKRWMSSIIRIGNPDLKWERSSEFNGGVEGLFLKNRLKTEINYFKEKRSNIIGSLSSKYGDYLGSYIYQGNMGTVKNHGVEGMFEWMDKSGDLIYSVGANFVWSKNKIVDWNEVPGIESYRSVIGKSTDAMFGYDSLGLFGKDVPLANHPFQAFGEYQEGDIAYRDLNGDNIIDDADRKMVGNSFPRTTMGININLEYKGWGLIAYGYAELGIKKWMSNSYYWNRGEDKYSSMALDRYHPVDNPSGSYPRLTTTSGENNFRNSTFWLLNTNYFRLKNMELSYTFTNNSVNAIAKKIKVFARGTNLFVLSSVKDLDPELLNSGVSNYPVYSTYTGGVSFTF